MDAHDQQQLHDLHHEVLELRSDQAELREEVRLALVMLDELVSVARALAGALLAGGDGDA